MDIFYTNNKGIEGLECFNLLEETIKLVFCMVIAVAHFFIAFHNKITATIVTRN